MIEDFATRRPTMKKAYVGAVIAAASAVTFAAAAVAGDKPGAGRPLEATLTGAAEVPGPGDADGSGTFVARVNAGRGEVCYELKVQDIAAASAAHIHEGAEGVAGDIVVPLDAPTSGESDGCATIDRELAMALIRTPENYYVNVHNADFPLGAVRGQLAK
jgi:hypothetical protein